MDFRVPLYSVTVERRKVNKILKRNGYQDIVSQQFAYDFVVNLTLYIYVLKRYGNPDIQNMGTLK